MYQLSACLYLNIAKVNLTDTSDLPLLLTPFHGSVSISLSLNIIILLLHNYTPSCKQFY